MKVIATYQSNYNGCSLEDPSLEDDLCEHPDPTIGKAAERAIDRITDTLYADCDEDGYYQGTENYAKRVMTDAVHEFLGVDVEVECVVDSTSS